MLPLFLIIHVNSNPLCVLLWALRNIKTHCSVYLSVCQKTLQPGLHFLKYICGIYFIFGTHDPMVLSQDLDHWPTLRSDLFQCRRQTFLASRDKYVRGANVIALLSALAAWKKALTFTISFKPEVIELSYCICVFLLIRPFTWYHNYWPCDLYLEVWPTFQKTLTLSITFKPEVIELSYCICVFLVTRPFTWYHNFWLCDLDLKVWPTFEKL